MTGVILLILRANDVHGLAFALAVFGGVMGMVGGAVALHAVNRVCTLRMRVHPG